MKRFMIFTVIMLLAGLALMLMKPYTGQTYAHRIGLIFYVLLCYVIISYYELNIMVRKKKVGQTKKQIDIFDVLGVLKDVGSNRVSKILDNVDRFDDVPYESLTPERQVMKSEKSAILARLRETERFLHSNEFKSWTLDKQEALYQQAGAMALYINCLVHRCLAEGVVIEKQK